MEIHCSVDLEWNTSESAGRIKMPAGTIAYADSEPADPRRRDPSPETLLVAAISSSYTITLSNLLQESRLPRTRIAVRADGAIAGGHERPQFTRLRVSLTIHGADVLRRDAYEKAAVTARDECPIGWSIRGNVVYVVGEVTLLRPT